MAGLRYVGLAGDLRQKSCFAFLISRLLVNLMVNNAGLSILRFVTHSGILLVNGRIVGVERVLKHEGDAREILRGLLKLLAHGAKQGW